MTAAISTANAEHYLWGAGCDGWHLLQRDDVSVIQERMPAGASEVMHHHNASRQFFFILSEEGTMIFEDQEITLRKGDALEVPPGARHQFCNRSGTDVHFLVISVPPSHGDRINS